MKNIRTNLIYRGVVVASALTTLVAVVAAGNKW
jgi:hypothetical protein